MKRKKLTEKEIKKYEKAIAEIIEYEEYMAEVREIEQDDKYMEEIRKNYSAEFERKEKAKKARKNTYKKD